MKPAGCNWLNLRCPVCPVCHARLKIGQTLNPTVRPTGRQRLQHNLHPASTGQAKAAHLFGGLAIVVVSGRRSASLPPAAADQDVSDAAAETEPAT
jgi:hypothetical protein